MVEKRVCAGHVYRNCETVGKRTEWHKGAMLVGTVSVRKCGLRRRASNNNTDRSLPWATKSELQESNYKLLAQGESAFLIFVLLSDHSVIKSRTAAVTYDTSRRAWPCYSFVKMPTFVRG